MQWVRLSLGSRAAPVGAARSRKQERGDVKQLKNRDPKKSTPGGRFFWGPKKDPLKGLYRQIREQKNKVLTFGLGTLFLCFGCFWCFLRSGEVRIESGMSKYAPRTPPNALRSKFNTRYFVILFFCKTFLSCFGGFWSLPRSREGWNRSGRCVYTRSDQFSSRTGCGISSYEAKTFQLNEY